MQQGLHEIENHELHSRLSLRSNSTPPIVRILTPFALVDLLGIAFVSRFNEWNNDSMDKHSVFLREMAAEIGDMGDALIHDWEALGLNDYGVGFDAAQVLSFKFFDPRSNLHRKHFADWFKSLLHYNDPLIRCFIFQATLAIHQTFLKKLTPCFSKQGKSSPLIFFNGKWFYYFQNKMQKQMQSLESDLSPEQEKIIAIEVDKIIKRFVIQMDESTQALANIDDANYLTSRLVR